MPPTPLRFGILGAARIAPKALILPAAKLPGVTVSAVAARDHRRAMAFAAAHGVERVLPTYRDVVTSDEVDVVYNPLPMSMHAEWTIAALRAGKHVLCEKPFSSNAAEAREMVRVAVEEGRILGEAFHYRYHPLFERVVEAVRAGRIGTLERIEGVFHATIAQPDLRWDYATSGGSLMDLGCYPVSWVRHITGEEPTIVSAVAVEGPDRIDASIQSEMTFPSGVTASISSAMDLPFDVSLTIVGSSGEIVVRNPLAPQTGNNLTITTAGGQTSGPVDAGTTYEHMVRAFVEHLIHDTPFPTRGEDSIANMVAIDAIYEAAGLPIRGL